MLKSSFAAVPVLAVLLFLAPTPRDAGAHSPAEFANAVVDYVPNFVHDVFDIFFVGVGVGEGYALDAHATHLLDVGVDRGTVKAYGIGGRGIVMAGNEFETDHAGVTVLGMTAGNNVHPNHELGLTVGYKAGVGLSLDIAKALDAFAGLIFIDTEGDNTSLGLFGGGGDSGEAPKTE